MSDSELVQIICSCKICQKNQYSIGFKLCSKCVQAMDLLKKKTDTKVWDRKYFDINYESKGKI